MCVECGTVLGGFGGVSFCCLWDFCGEFGGYVCVLFVVQFGAGLGE